MSFANLETCESIAGEFPDVEHFWIRNTESGKLWPTPQPRSRNLTETILGGNGYPDKIIKYERVAPAPTCEELGKFLVKFHQDRLTDGYFSLLKSDEICHEVTAGLYSAFYGDNNPAQELGNLAVKLILELK